MSMVSVHFPFVSLCTIPETSKKYVAISFGTPFSFSRARFVSDVARGQRRKMWWVWALFVFFTRGRNKAPCYDLLHLLLGTTDRSYFLSNSFASLEKLCWLSNFNQQRVANLPVGSEGGLLGEKLREFIDFLKNFDHKTPSYFNYSELMKPNDRNMIHSGFIFSFIQLKHMKIHDFAGRLKLPLGPNTAQPPQVGKPCLRVNTNLTFRTMVVDPSAKTTSCIICV